MGRGVGVMVDFGVGLVGASVGVGVGVEATEAGIVTAFESKVTAV